MTTSPAHRTIPRRGHRIASAVLPARTSIPVWTADFHPSLDTSAIEAVFYKGAYTGAYSGFEGVDENGTPLLNWLRQRGVDEVDVVGIATDHCVRQTAEDAVRNGLATRVLVDLTAGVSADTTVAALEEMRTASVELVCSS